MGLIRIVGKRGKGSFESQLDSAAAGLDFVQIDCTSHNPDKVMNEGLSPFYLGPVDCYDGFVSQTFERAWQCAKVYPWMVGADGNPDDRYFAWRDEMWAKRDFGSRLEIRFPAGKENARGQIRFYFESYCPLIDGEPEFDRWFCADGRKRIDAYFHDNNLPLEMSVRDPVAPSPTQRILADVIVPNVNWETDLTEEDLNLILDAYRAIRRALDDAKVFGQ